MEFLLDTVDLKKIKYYCDKLNVKGVRFTNKAKEAIEKNGGKIEVL